MNESMDGEQTPSGPQDRVTETIEQQTAVSDVLRAIASSPYDMQPIFDAILRYEGTPFWLVGCGHHSHWSQKRGAFRIDWPNADCLRTSRT
jgi:hypothetical protein